MRNFLLAALVALLAAPLAYGAERRATASSRATSWRSPSSRTRR